MLATRQNLLVRVSPTPLTPGKWMRERESEYPGNQSRKWYIQGKVNSLLAVAALTFFDSSMISEDNTITHCIYIELIRTKENRRQTNAIQKIIMWMSLDRVSYRILNSTQMTDPQSVLDLSPDQGCVRVDIPHNIININSNLAWRP